MSGGAWPRFLPITRKAAEDARLKALRGGAVWAPTVEAAAEHLNLPLLDERSDSVLADLGGWPVEVRVTSCDEPHVRTKWHLLGHQHHLGGSSYVLERQMDTLYRQHGRSVRRCLQARWLPKSKRSDSL